MSQKPYTRIKLEEVVFLGYYYGPGRTRYVSDPCDYDKAAAAIRGKYPGAEYLQSNFAQQHEFVCRVGEGK